MGVDISIKSKSHKIAKLSVWSQSGTCMNRRSKFIPAIDLRTGGNCIWAFVAQLELIGSEEEDEADVEVEVEEDDDQEFEEAEVEEEEAEEEEIVVEDWLFEPH